MQALPPLQLPADGLSILTAYSMDRTAPAVCSCNSLSFRKVSVLALCVSERSVSILRGSCLSLAWLD